MFSKETASELQKLFPKAQFKPAGKQSMTIELSNQYKTNDPQEEVPCPFLDKTNGCSLPPELKPFDCSIWPFRAVRINQNEIKVALTPTCPAVNKVAREKIIALLQEGLEKKILDYAASNPDIIKENSSFFEVLPSTKS